MECLNIMNRDRQQKKIIDYFNLWFKINLYITLLLFLRVGPVQNSLTLNLGTFQFKPLQDGHLSKGDKSFCPVSVGFREVPLYNHFQSKYCESRRVEINKIEFVKLTHSIWKNGVAANKNCCNKFCGINRHL